MSTFWYRFQMQNYYSKEYHWFASSGNGVIVFNPPIGSTPIAHTVTGAFLTISSWLETGEVVFTSTLPRFTEVLISYPAKDIFQLQYLQQNHNEALDEIRERYETLLGERVYDVVRRYRKFRISGANLVRVEMREMFDMINERGLFTIHFLHNPHARYRRKFLVKLTSFEVNKIRGTDNPPVFEYDFEMEEVGDRI